LLKDGFTALVQDATNAAAMARDKLMERGEKLQVRPFHLPSKPVAWFCFPLTVLCSRWHSPR